MAKKAVVVSICLSFVLLSSMYYLPSVTWYEIHTMNVCTVHKSVPFMKCLEINFLLVKQRRHCDQ